MSACRFKPFEAINPHKDFRYNVMTVSQSSSSSRTSEALWSSPFVKACRREPAEVTPIWLMRQAGRYMAEYRAVRDKVSFLEMCKRPELADPGNGHRNANRLGRRRGSDSLCGYPPHSRAPGAGSGEFATGEGPVIHNPVRTAADVDRIRPLGDIAPLAYVMEAVGSIRAALPPTIPLIGFAGAPFTLACYVIEGAGSRHYDQAKSFMYADLGAWNALMERLTAATTVYLNAQAQAGAQALQVFDSWVGALAPHDYRKFVQPHMIKLFSALDPSVPVIHFGTGTSTLLELQRDAGGSVIGLDWRVELDQAWRQLGHDVAVQGNLDPVVLLSSQEEIETQARRILAEAGGRPGHIFNLGHGILPQTPVDNVLALVDVVHTISRRS